MTIFIHKYRHKIAFMEKSVDTHQEIVYDNCIDLLYNNLLKSVTILLVVSFNYIFHFDYAIDNTAYTSYNICGFDSLNTFYRAYRRIYGNTPLKNDNL